ncbi:hypothetical protein C5167_009587 [Papaver somniferum]|uniref:UspA domain-containing protein n=2 Tax=Papaver somniferum TaxID=3469 RepID=A0A4Y7K1S3_PAPSO|nr:hypothetical protein C5167_009587 [Papaver somniferum]
MVEATNHSKMQKNNPYVEDVDPQDDKSITSGLINRITSQNNNEENNIIGTYDPNIKRSISNREGSSIQHRIPPTIVEEYKDINRVSSSRIGERYKIYVAVGKSKSSRDALIWALKHLLHDIPPSLYSSTFIYLIHVYPEILYVPVPVGIGKLHKDTVNPLLYEDYKNKKIEQRKQFLDDILRLCSGCKVKVDTLLIEGNDVAKALIDLIPILNIEKLIIGTKKSSYRKLKRPHGIADQILKAALPDSCDIKIIGHGKELIDIEYPIDMFKDKSPFSSSRMSSSHSRSTSGTIMDKALSLSRMFSSRSSSSNDGSIGNLTDFDS